MEKSTETTGTPVIQTAGGGGEDLLDQWLVFVTVLLGPQDRHPAVLKPSTLI